MDSGMDGKATLGEEVEEEREMAASVSCCDGGQAMALQQ